MSISKRQVHLDFHTSELIPDVGAKFDRENFMNGLKRGNVGSITLFAKCHHSMCYYPTKIGIMHPGLKFDLLGEQIHAAHSIGIKAPIYITAGWSAVDAQNEKWLARNKDGTAQTMNYNVSAPLDEPRPFVSWKMLCLSGEYAKHIYALTEEICQNYSTDGLFYDICFCNDTCYCEACLAGMQSLGLDPENIDNVRKYYILKHQEFMKCCGEILHKYHKNATIYFNGASNTKRTQYHHLESHYELEDLPTTWGGYDKLPFRAKFFAQYNKPITAMTGKFHTNWGEFGGYKTENALKFECATMLAFGAGCSIGDQMHPLGFLDTDTYRLVGSAYQYVESIEALCSQTKLYSNLGVWLSSDDKSCEGLSKILLENQLDFDYACKENVEKLDTLIIPNDPTIDSHDVKAIEKFVKDGKNLIIFGNAVNHLSSLGIEYIGKSTSDCDYVQVQNHLMDCMLQSPFLFYDSANMVKADGFEVLARVFEPYFNRTYRHYSSHMNTPFQDIPAGYPALIRKNNIVYFAHDVCKIYYEYGSTYHREYVCQAIKLIYHNQFVHTKMESCGRVTLRKSAENNCFILHVLYASPIKRGIAEIIDDILPVYHIPFQIRLQEQIKQVILQPQGKTLPFENDENSISFVLPELDIHQLIELKY